MLSTLRRGAHGFFSKVLLGFLVITFAIWGIGDIVNNAGTAYVAKVGKAEITLSAYEAEMRKLRQSFGENYSPELLKRFNLYQLKLAEMINQRLLDLEADRLGIHVSDDDLAHMIARNPAFKNAGGEFDKGLFYQALQQLGMSEGEFLDGLRKDLAAQVLIKTFSLHPPMPEALLDAVYKTRYEQRKVLLVSAESVPEATISAPQESELVAFYNAHKEQYTAPEYRRLRYVFIAPETILEKSAVTRQEAMDAYQLRQGEFAEPEQRHINQLLYETKTEAQDAYDLLQSGTNFDNVAKEVPPTNPGALSLGFKYKEELPAGSEEVFALNEGEHTVPIQSPFGWHIFFVKSIKPQQTAPFDTVRMRLEQELRQTKADKLLQETTEQLEDKLASGTTMQAAAQELNLTYAETDPINDRGQKADNSQALDPAQYKALLDTAFSLPAGERSSVSSTSEGAYYVVEVAAVTEARERAFEEVRGQVSQDWKATKREEQYLAHLGELANHLKTLANGERAARLAEENLTTTPFTLTRSGAEKREEMEKLPQDFLMAFIPDLFLLSGPGETTGVHPFKKGYAFGILQDVIAAPDPKSEEGKRNYTALKRSLREDYTQEILNQYIAALRERYPVEINETALKTMIEE